MKAVDCLQCMREIASDSQRLECSDCGNCYHTGRCSGVTKNSFKTMSPVERDSWSCATCAARQARLTPAQAADKAEVSQARAVELSLDSVLKKLDDVIRRLDLLEKKQDSQRALQDEMNQKIELQTNTIQGMETAFDVLSSKHDDILKSLETQGQQLKKLEKKVSDLEVQLLTKDSRISQLELEVENLEQYSRKNNIEIHGVPARENEDLMQVVASIAQKLSLPVPTTEQIEAVHRIKAKSNLAPPILVRFFRRDVRDSWLGKRTVLKSEKIFINENLTARVKKLLWLSKCCAKEKAYKFVWARNGRVYARKLEGAPLIRIDNEAGLNNLT